MGSCFSKKGPSDGGFSSSSPKVVVSATTPKKPNLSPSPPQPVGEVTIKKKPAEKRRDEEAEKEDDSSATKEIVVIRHRKSHDRAPQQQHKVPDGVASTGSDASSHKSADLELEGTSNINFITAAPAPAAGVRTSSCTKDEVDAILIQCGRLSRSSSSQAASGSSAGRSRKYCGSKRSYDGDADADADDYGGDDAEERHHRQSRPSPQGRRRRTPSREREQQNQRSNSKERSSGSGSRRVSRSPGKRSVNRSTTTNGSAHGNANARPGKLVSVPATVSSLVMENGCAEPATVKRNVGAASPRVQSPARGIANVSNENVRARSPARTNGNGCIDNQQPSLSRSSSRKAEQSPYRRNPLSEIDPNSHAYPQPTKAVHIKSKEFEADGQEIFHQKPNVSQGANKVMDVKCATKERHQQQEILEEAKGHSQMTRNNVTVTAVPRASTRSRSSRQSQDLDQNPETLWNSNPSYTSLLLEDIHNFHQKTTSFSLPPCVTKACSILEAVADLNCGTISNLSCTFSEERMRLPICLHSAANLAGKKRAQHKDPFLESEAIVNDDLMEPSLHKYVTVRRGGRGTQLGGGEVEEEESSGSNSFAGGGGQQHWGASSSSWEPNSADSTDRWTSRSSTKMDDQSPLESVLQMEEARGGFSGERRDFDHQQTGIGHGRVGGNRGPQAVAVAAST